MELINGVEVSPEGNGILVKFPNKTEIFLQPKDDCIKISNTVKHNFLPLQPEKIRHIVFLYFS